MDYKKINDLFTDLTSFRHKYNIVQKEQTSTRDEYESIYDRRYEIYDAKLEDNYFVKISYITDSYGNHEEIAGISFVKGEEKKITVYEFN